MSLLAALRVSLSMDSAQFEAGAKRAQRTAFQTRGAMQKAFGGLGALTKGAFAGLVSGLSIGLLTQGVKAALDYAGSLGEVAQQLGVTTKDLQTFRYAAGQTGVSQQQLETGLSKLTITLGKVAAGAKAPTAALDAIGISAKDLAGLDTGEAFRKIADGLEKIPDRAQRAAVEVALFGKSGAQLDNLLSGGSAALNELADAAERLGIVLSNEQIQSADDAADKLEALKTVLSAKIAGIVADNANSILQLADSLVVLIDKAGAALRAWNDFKNALDAQAYGIAASNPFLSAEKRREGAELAARARGRISDNGIGWGVGGSKVIIDLPPATKPRPKTTDGNIKPFLAGGSGGRKRSSKDDANRAQIEKLRNQFQLDNDIRRADMDILRAKQQLAHDYVERTALSIQMLDLDKQAYEAELAYQQELYKLTDGKDGLSKADADILKAKYDQRDALERQAVLDEEEADRKRDYYALEQADFDIAREKLESERQLANNSAERRDVELRLLDLAYRQERARLEAVLADEKSSYAAKEEARRRLAALNTTYKNDREGVMRDTAGPLESARLQFSDITDEMEQLKVDGIMGVADALTALTGGFENFRQAAINAIKQIIAEFIRLQMIKMLFNVLGSAAGGGVGGGGGNGIGSMGGAPSFSGYVGIGTPGFATGGSFNIMGNKGVDRNMLSLNGLPIARVSHGERLSIGKGEGGRSINAPITFNISGNPSRETMGQIAAKTRQGIASANRKGFS